MRIQLILLLAAIVIVSCASEKQNILIEKTNETEQIRVETKEAIIANHTNIDPDKIPLELIKRAKDTLNIVYWHTSHGSQITDGLSGLAKFNELYNSLNIKDNPPGKAYDLGNPDNKAWAAQTKKYLKDNKDINVVIWSWCGQLSNADKAYVQNYLDLMQELEKEFPYVSFIYMTGHLDGTGENGNLNINNNYIRDFCVSNKKVLFDFADIESYNPDGKYFADKYANDACDYDSNGDKIPDKNWAIEWQQSHTEGVEWYKCDSAHSQPINANMKAYAMWSLLARVSELYK